MKSILVTARRAAGALATIVMLAGISSATPIVDLTDSGAVVSALNHGVVSRAAASPPAVSESNSSSNFYTLGITNWPASSSNCTLSGDCRTTTKVPEPQSLVLVGSGLLSMAGFIRRKLAR